MARRIKNSGPIINHIADWAEADEYVRNIGNLVAMIDYGQAQAQKKIDKVKADLSEKVTPFQETIKLYTRSLEAFAESHKADFGSQKSRKLNFGDLGWRKSTPIEIAKNTLELIKKVLSRPNAYIHIKESVNKKALAKLTDKDLNAIGARREDKDVFFVEPSLHEAADYTE